MGDKDLSDSFFSPNPNNISIPVTIGLRPPNDNRPIPNCRRPSLMLPPLKASQDICILLNPPMTGIHKAFFQIQLPIPFAMSPNKFILAPCCLPVAPPVLASKNALSKSNPKPIANATGAPTPVKYNNPESADKTSITPPTLSPLLNREMANPMEIILPSRGIFLRTLTKGFKKFNILAIIPPPFTIPPRALKGAPIIPFREFINPVIPPVITLIISSIGNNLLIKLPMKFFGINFSNKLPINLSGISPRANLSIILICL